LALNGVLQCFRLLSTLRLNKVLGPLILMIMKMIVDLINFMSIFFLLICGFTVTMYSMFKQIEGYHTLGTTLLTLFKAALGEFDYDALQQSAKFGKFDSTYMYGSSLLCIFLLLATVLLLNLVVARFSSTYLRIEKRSYQEWCLLVADLCKEHHTAKDTASSHSALCAVPAPLNILTAIAALLEMVVEMSSGAKVPLQAWCANMVFAICVNFPACIAMHFIAPAASLFYILQYALLVHFEVSWIRGCVCADTDAMMIRNRRFHRV
jgi:hypothetical protein